MVISLENTSLGNYSVKLRRSLVPTFDSRLFSKLCLKNTRNVLNILEVFRKFSENNMLNLSNARKCLKNIRNV
jgi:hypothetical protein